MKKQTWIVLDFVLATLVAVLGNIVATYLQDQFRLTEPTRFGLVGGLFVISLGLLLWLTLKREGQEAVVAARGTDPDIDVKQKVGTVEGGGSIAGIEGDTLLEGTSARVDQEAESVAGTVTGMRLNRLGGSKPSEGPDEVKS